MWPVNPTLLFCSTIALQIALTSQESYASTPYNNGYSSNQLIWDHHYAPEDYYYTGYSTALPSRQGGGGGKEEGKEMDPGKKGLDQQVPSLGFDFSDFNGTKLRGNKHDQELSPQIFVLEIRTFDTGSFPRTHIQMSFLEWYDSIQEKTFLRE